MRLGALRNSEAWLECDLPSMEYEAKTPDDLIKAMIKVMEVAKVHWRCQHKHQAEALADTLAQCSGPTTGPFLALCEFHHLHMTQRVQRAK